MRFTLFRCAAASRQRFAASALELRRARRPALLRTRPGSVRMQGRGAILRPTSAHVHRIYAKRGRLRSENGKEHKRWRARDSGPSVNENTTPSLSACSGSSGRRWLLRNASVTAALAACCSASVGSKMSAPPASTTQATEAASHKGRQLQRGARREAQVVSCTRATARGGKGVWRTEEALQRHARVH